jgi:3-oxoacyl-[acyl-carrier protein] reductase
MSKTILITGASTGIGAGTAELLADGNEIIIHYYHSEDKAKKVKEIVEKNNGKGFLVKADLSTEKGCLELVEAVKSNYEKIDVLFNNAGGAVKRYDIKEIDWKSIEEIMTLNTYSTIFLTSKLVPLLEKGDKPCIINITSVAMRNGSPSVSVYAASKGALDTFTRSTARALAPKIRVNAIAPGVIDTPFHEKVTAPERMKEFKDSIPLNILGEPHHIAEAVQFLIENEFMTGATLDINGGAFMY